MVYEKVRSGDPDYDDKQPPEFHAGGEVVSAGDGVRLTKTNGPVDAEGAHVNLAVDTQDLDNRPSPGNVASAPSEVQDYSVEDTPTYAEATEADSKDVDAIAASQASVRAQSEAAGQTDVKTQDVANAETPTTPAKATAATKKTTTGTTN
jgi:hypothetical protein